MWNEFSKVFNWRAVAGWRESELWKVYSKVIRKENMSQIFEFRFTVFVKLILFQSKNSQNQLLASPWHRSVVCNYIIFLIWTTDDCELFRLKWWFKLCWWDLLTCFPLHSLVIQYTFLNTKFWSNFVINSKTILDGSVGRMQKGAFMPNSFPKLSNKFFFHNFYIILHYI